MPQRLLKSDRYCTSDGRLRLADWAEHYRRVVEPSKLQYPSSWPSSSRATASPHHLAGVLILCASLSSTSELHQSAKKAAPITKNDTRTYPTLQENLPLPRHARGRGCRSGCFGKLQCTRERCPLVLRSELPPVARCERLGQLGSCLHPRRSLRREGLFANDAACTSSHDCERPYLPPPRPTPFSLRPSLSSVNAMSRLPRSPVLDRVIQRSALKE